PPQPHLPVFDGVPNTVKKYHSGLRMLFGFLDSCSRRIDSRLMIVVAAALPASLVPALTRARAAFFCSAVMSTRGSPLRVVFFCLSCKGMKFQLVRSSLS